MEFLFSRPEHDDRLSVGVNTVVAMGAIANRMAMEERTRVFHADGRPENVAEHSYMLAKTALALADIMYPWMDRGAIAIGAISHDDVEAYVGDTPTDPVAGHSPLSKKELEEAGLAQLAKEYTPIAPGYVTDVVSYEAQESYEAQFVRIVDKSMPLMMHIIDQGGSIKKNYTYDEFVKNSYAKEQELLDEYPHFIELIELRTELALHVAEFL